MWGTFSKSTVLGYFNATHTLYYKTVLHLTQSLTASFWFGKTTKHYNWNYPESKASMFLHCCSFPKEGPEIILGTTDVGWIGCCNTNCIRPFQCLQINDLFSVATPHNSVCSSGHQFFVIWEVSDINSFFFFQVGTSL